MQHLEFWPKLCEQRYMQNKNCLPPFFQILYRERGEGNIALRGVVSGAVRPVVLPSPHSPSLALEQSMCGHWLKTLFFSAEFAALKFKLQTEILRTSLQKITSSVIFCTPKSLSILHIYRVMQPNCWSLLSNKLCYDLWYTLYCRSSVQHGALIIGSKL